MGKRMVLHRAPVVVWVDEVQASIGCHRGQEFDEAEPICRDPNLQWLFEDDSADPVQGNVEQATAAPGERRGTRRQRAE